MDFELNEDQRAFADTARQFAQAELAPHAARLGCRGHLPGGGHRQSGRAGLLRPVRARDASAAWPLPRLDATLVFEELAAVDPSTTAFITIHNMATWMLGTWATDEVRAEWGEQLTSGQKLASYCLTEPGSGSDAASIKTRAELVGGEYVINGSKAFISGAGCTDVLVLMARTGDAQSGAGGISAFAVPRRPARHPATAKKKKKWAGTASPRAPSALTTCAFPPTTCSGARARASRLP